MDNQRLILLAAAAVAGYMYWPQIQAAVPDLTRTLQPVLSSVTHTMRPDPTAKDRIEDRRGGIGRIGGDPGGDLGRLGPPPQQGARGGGMPPWEQAGNEDFPGEGFPGPEAGGGGYPRDPQGRPPYRRWRDCTGSRQHPRCGPWHTGPEPDDR